MLKSFEGLDRGRMPCDLVGVEAGQEIELSRELVVQVVKTTHTIPSVGYVVFERRNKLKAEFADLSGDQIRDLKLGGTEITEEKRVPVVAYTGDTSPKGLDDNPIFYDAKVLITEMTFVAPDHRKELIHKNGHMHLDDFVKRRSNFKNELVIASHLSVRYNRREAEKHISRKLPEMLDGRLKLWL